MSMTTNSRNTTAATVPNTFTQRGVPAFARAWSSIWVSSVWRPTMVAYSLRDAILDSAAALVAERGLSSVKMSRIAEKTGIGRATLYKYFSSVEAILTAWHERHVTSHLEHLA